MTIVLIDTNAYETQSYRMSSWQFGKIKRLSERYDINLYTTDLIIYEIEMRIKKQISKDYEVLKEIMSLCKDVRFLPSIPEYELLHTLKHKIGKMPKNKAVKCILENIHTHFSECNYTKFESGKILTSELIELYKNLEAPFSESKDNEFKDAIILLAFQKAVESYRKNIKLVNFTSSVAVISNDGDWKTFVEQNIPNSSIYENIYSFLRDMNDPDECDHLENNVLINLNDIMKDEISSSFKDFDFDVRYCYTSGSELYKVNDFDYEVVEIDKGEKTIVFKYLSDFECVVQYENTGYSYYKGEQIYHDDYIGCEIEETFEISGLVTATYKSEKVTEITSEELEIIDVYHSETKFDVWLVDPDPWDH